MMHPHILPQGAGVNIYAVDNLEYSRVVEVQGTIATPIWTALVLHAHHFGSSLSDERSRRADPELL